MSAMSGSILADRVTLPVADGSPVALRMRGPDAPVERARLARRLGLLVADRGDVEAEVFEEVLA